MISGEKIIEILVSIGDKIEENKVYLTELDASIGDGDHGLNMSKGFLAVKEALKDVDSKNIGGILKKAGMALVSHVGGASGPLYGTAFMKAAVIVKDKESVGIDDFINILKAAIDGVVMRGKAQEGDKTMLDAIMPAYRAGKASREEGKACSEVLEAVSNAALKGAENTEKIAAKKGRASYLGDRSIGHKDPGAVSASIMLKTIYDCLK